MEPITFNQTVQKTTEKKFEESYSKVALEHVFAERRGYLNPLTLFLVRFNTIPNVICEEYIDCEKANKWFLEKYKCEVKSSHFYKRYIRRKKQSVLDEIFYFIDEDLLVYFDISMDTVTFLFSNTNITTVELLVADTKKFKINRKKRKPIISLLVSTSNGIDTSFMEISNPRLNIESNYNDDFKPIHETIYKRLSKRNDKGVVILHGKPGTGKTSYIRYLISKLKKNVIFLPPNMANAITNPELVAILINNPNSIFVIEDAENIVVDREKEGNSPVSALLNVSDGLLSDCLNVQIICSFNTDISKVDSALLRKGRLIAQYEFKELEITKAQTLSKKLGFNTRLNSPMTLAAIYNQDENDFQKINNCNSIGFKV